MEFTEDLIPCETFNGGQVMVPRKKFRFRPAVYGLIQHEAHLLLVQLNNGNYVLPGGGIDKGERVKAALQREVHEETGVRIANERFLSFREDFVYFPRHDRAIHTHRFFYDCEALSYELTNAYNIPSAIDNETPKWTAYKALPDLKFHFASHGEIVLDYVRH